MTAKELSQLYHINREIEGLQKRLDYLLAGKEKWKSHDTVMTSNGPGNTPRTERVIGLAFEYMDNPFKDEIAALRDEIKDHLRKCLQERRRLERYINSVDDSETRQILSLRFISGLPWAQVAAHISPYATEDSVKQACHRFLKKPVTNVTTKRDKIIS